MTPESFALQLRSTALEQGWTCSETPIRGHTAAVAIHRFRERAGSYGVVWTKCVVVCTGIATPTRTELDRYTGAAGSLGLRRTRWQLPFRGVQGGTLVMALAAVPSLDRAVAEWAQTPPWLRFAAMIAPVAVDLSDGTVHLNRDEPRLGRVFTIDDFLSPTPSYVLLAISSGSGHAVHNSSASDYGQAP